MSKIIRNVQKKFARMERGQVLVVVALAAIGIIAIMGLAIDVGIMFIENARLRRAVDSAALSAALQYRQGYNISSLTRSANEFLVLNGLTNPNSTVQNCDNTPSDTELCSTPRRKLVRVHATADVQLAFLPVIGINTVPVAATAVSEAASLDVVLVIDRSESMTYTATGTDPMRDPAYCNVIPITVNGVVQASSCAPFYQVVAAAIQFTNILFFPYDNAAIVTFDSEARVNLTLASGTSSAAVINTLKALTVYQGEGTYKSSTSNVLGYRCYGVENECTGPVISGGPALRSGVTGDICTSDPDYTGGVSNYKGLLGRGQDPCYAAYTEPPAPYRYTTTNIGGGLLLAGNEFATDSRQSALWVVILLTDGVANAGHNADASVYYCPQDTWSNLPRCNDLDVAADATRATRGSAPTSSAHEYADTYDASDYAYDMADYIGLPYPTGQFALIYTIGLGSFMNDYPQAGYADPYSYPAGATGEGLGKIFLNYAAGIARGQAFYAASGSDLNKIFRLIGTNIATRLSK